ncbi:MAG: acyl-CoA dehydrogenase family protein [Myxococcales bacterium]|nr:acyl-CoA dehydrogenase family protein [Myxococcales bacterium]
MSFFQDPPKLGNQYHDDRVIQSVVRRHVPADGLATVEEELASMGALAGDELYRAQLADRQNEPLLVQWDPWGNRVDRIELTAVWKRAAQLAAERGVVATAYEGRLGEASRIHQFALAYLFDPSTDTYTCPLAMTDGAARTLLEHDDRVLAERAVPHLTHRDPAQAWTSGQWMTERTGGSDVGLTETRAEPMESGAYGVSGAHRLYGTKWFTSAATSQMALTLARPVGEPPGGRGLTLFYLETVRDDGSANGIAVNRLKDKLGTRKLPTAELTLHGAVAVPVAGLGHGIRNITPMLNVTRTWNAVSSVAILRRGVALAADYAVRRHQFGTALHDKPLHADTLAGVQAELEGATLMAFRVVALLGRHEAGTATDQDRQLLRVLTPIAKLLTAKQAVAGLSEILECFGGAGYVEDTGLPRLLRDAQVLPIWEGTTNVLSLDMLRALGRQLDLGPIERELQRLQAPQAAVRAFEAARAWLVDVAGRDRGAMEAGARRLALTLGRSLQLALLADHARWCEARLSDPRPGVAAARFSAAGVSCLASVPAWDEARATWIPGSAAD